MVVQPAPTCQAESRTGRGFPGSRLRRTDAARQHPRRTGGTVNVRSILRVTAWMMLMPLCSFAGEEPLGVGMESFPYPHPVQMLELRMEGEPVRMAYMDVPPAGKSNGESVVLLHGRNFFGAYWQDTIEALRRAGYRVVVPDQIGFGKSSKPDVPHSLHVHRRAGAEGGRRLTGRAAGHAGRRGTQSAPGSAGEVSPGSAAFSRALIP
jgi:hypothetical protein